MDLFDTYRMMTKSEKHFLELLYIFHASAMQGLGKVKSPLTGEIVRDTDQTKHSIEMLEMLEEISAGNLGSEMQRALRVFLDEARLAWQQEMKKN